MRNFDQMAFRSSMKKIKDVVTKILTRFFTVIHKTLIPTIENSVVLKPIYAQSLGMLGTEGIVSFSVIPTRPTSPHILLKDGDMLWPVVHLEKTGLNLTFSFIIHRLWDQLESYLAFMNLGESIWNECKVHNPKHGTSGLINEW